MFKYIFAHILKPMADGALENAATPQPTFLPNVSERSGLFLGLWLGFAAAEISARDPRMETPRCRIKDGTEYAAAEPT